MIPPRSASVPELECTEVSTTIRAYEAGQHIPGRDSSSPVASSSEAVRRHLLGCAACARRHGRRWNRLEALLALRSREVPRGLLDGLYEDVRARSHLAAPGGGMSGLFLDAPRALRMWRTVAVAASLILVAGAGFLLVGGGQRVDEGGRDPRAVLRPLEDARGRLLEAFRPIPRRPAEGVLVRPVMAPSTRGHEAFFGPPRAQPVDHDTEPRREVQLR